MPVSASRSHDFSAGHRVHGHEGKCQHLHGHNYRVHFEVVPIDGALDGVGRVMDFGAIKVLCNFLEREWDHRLLIWVNDPWLPVLQQIDPQGVVMVPFNPTAERMAMFLVDNAGPVLLAGTGCRLAKVIIEETRKCSASFSL
jgi:6-pyruvoyltetrahydropterin/6-carboxytetrahydropterin synthase